MKRFIYIEQEEGGMSIHENMTETLWDYMPMKDRLLGWMTGVCEWEDIRLAEWAATAEVGEYTEHRLGICIRVKDDDGGIT